jgi:branched-chain amino acid transport system substrate-binding protein
MAHSRTGHGWGAVGSRALVVASAVLLAASCSSSSGSKPATTSASPSTTSGGSPSSASTAPTTTPAPSGPPIKIGFIASFSGDYAKSSDLVKGTLTAWVDYVNAHGGILKRPVQIVLKDDQFSPDNTIQDVRDMVDSGITIIEGPIELSSVLQPLQKLSFVNFTFGGIPTESDPKLFPNTFLTYPPPNLDALNIGQYAVKQGSTKWAVVADTTASEQYVLPAYTQAAAQVGAQIVFKQNFDPATVDFSPIVAKVKSSGADGIFLLSVGAPVARFMQAVQAAGVKTTIYGNASIPASDLSTAPKDVLNNQVAYSVIKSGLLLADGTPPPDYSGYLQVLATVCSTCAVGGITNHFDSYNLMKYAIETAGSTDPAAIRHVLETQVSHLKVSSVATFTCSATNHDCYPQTIAEGLGIARSAVSTTYPGFFQPVS